LAEFLKIKSLDDLKSIETSDFEEGLTLEYKSSDALCKEKADDMCKDVSAFANSSGGQIIYGMKEEDKKPKIDAGVSDPKISKEWIQQILNTRLRPRVQVEIERIEITPGHHAFVLTIPPTKTGPHQHTDKRYYRRYEATQLVMDDQEIRDVMGRATTPDLFVSLGFLGGARERIEFPSGREESKPFNLLTRIANRAAQPAYHVVVEIGIAEEFIMVISGDYERLPNADNELGSPMHWFRWVRASPPGLPIFKEHPTLLTNNVLMLALTSLELRTNHLFDATIRISAPGFSSTEHWAFVCRGATLNIYGPGSEFAAKPTA